MDISVSIKREAKVVMAVRRGLPRRKRGAIMSLRSNGPAWAAALQQSPSSPRLERYSSRSARGGRRRRDISPLLAFATIVVVVVGFAAPVVNAFVSPQTQVVRLSALRQGGKNGLSMLPSSCRRLHAAAPAGGGTGASSTRCVGTMGGACLRFQRG